MAIRWALAEPGVTFSVVWPTQRKGNFNHAHPSGYRRARPDFQHCRLSGFSQTQPPQTNEPALSDEKAKSQQNSADELAPRGTLEAGKDPTGQRRSEGDRVQ